jgi:chemotaxis protein MotB
MDRFYNQPQLLNEDIPPELQNEQLRKENHNLNQELHRLQKISGDSKNLISEVEWHKWKLKRAKIAIINYKNSALKILRKKDLLLKEYEEIVHGDDLPKDKKPPSIPVIRGLKSEVDELAKENKKLSQEKDFFKKEIEEMESKVLSMEEKEINDTKEFKPHSETRVAVSTEFSNGLESFLVTYSDLITLILVIFVLLYSISKVDGGKFTEVFSSFQEKDIQLQHRNVRLDTKEFEMLKHVRELVKDNVDPESLVRSDVRTILIRLKSSDLFAPGSADLKEGAEDLILDSIQKDMKDGVKQIHVDGHTDNVPMKDNGPFPSNWELSSVRASHVARVIISKANFPPDRVVIAGYGEYRPLKPNKNDDDRALNRRVEIKILKDIQVEEEIKTIKSPKLY